MPPLTLIPPFPKSVEARLVLALVVMGGGLMMAGRQIVALNERLAAKPEIFDAYIDDRTEDVRRGPVTIKRKSVTTPDGTKTVESERVIGPVETHTTSKTETEHKETPIGPAETKRTRYVGVGIDPLDYARLPRFRAGVTFLGRLDVGAAYDGRFKPRDGAFQIETSYRF